MNTMIDRPIAWPAVVAGITLAWAILFWAIFFVGLSWNLLGIPMGLGGAIYPMIFGVPVFVGVFVYAGLATSLSGSLTRKARLWLSLGVPVVAVPLILVLFCPMDSEDSFITSFLSRFP